MHGQKSGTSRLPVVTNSAMPLITPSHEKSGSFATPKKRKHNKQNKTNNNKNTDGEVVDRSGVIPDENVNLYETDVKKRAVSTNPTLVFPECAAR